MADYPVLDGNSDTIVAESGEGRDLGKDYPVLDGNGAEIASTAFAGARGNERVVNGDMLGSPSWNGVGVTGYQSVAAVSAGNLEINCTVLSSGCNSRIVPEDTELYGSELEVTFDVYVPSTFSGVQVKIKSDGAESTVQSLTTGSWIEVAYTMDYVKSGDRPVYLSFQNNTSTTDKILVRNLSAKKVIG